MRDWLQKLLSKINLYHYISATPPHGAGFAAAVSHVLAREQGWVAWKRDNCKDFERKPEAAPEPAPPAPVMRRRPRPGAAVGGLYKLNPVDPVDPELESNLVLVLTRPLNP